VPGAPVAIGFFGKIPATGDFVAAGLPRTFIDRWDRWMSMELAARPDDGELDPRVWRFVVAAGIFGPEPCAGAWRMSEDRVGRRYPFAVVRLGPPPDPADPWFDAVAAAVRGASEGQPPGWVASAVSELSQPETSGDSGRILFWRDDWEVNELGFADIHDLAANGLPAMRANKPEVEAI
jgi:type VI secretion system protein ImpM